MRLPQNSEITFGERTTIMTQEQLNAIQAKTRKITNPQLLEIIRRLKKAADEKVNPGPEEQTKYIDALMEANRTGYHNRYER